MLIDIKGADQVAADISLAGGVALSTTMDVRDAAAWDSLVADTLHRFGAIDILVNNAGIAVPGDTAVDVSEDIWDRSWTQCQGRLARHESGAAEHDREQARQDLQRRFDGGPYRPPERRRLLRFERRGAGAHPAGGRAIRPFNIQINSVSPGTTMTGLQRDVTDEQRAAFLPLTPIGRFAAPEEVAAVILFLCSEGSSFMAGADVGVDGGMVAL